MAGPTTPFEDAVGTDPAWTTLSEEATFLSAVVSGSGRVTKVALGQSAVDANPMDLYAVGYPEPPTEAELRSKSNILILAMQHGNEPSGRDAALQYLRDLAYATDVETLKYLKSHPVMFIPTANPDGFPNSRENGNGVDLNRQWLSYSQSENQAIGKALRDYHPHILLDAHEMFDRTYQFEFLHPENPAIHPDIMSSALSLRNALMADATSGGYTNGLYPRDDQERVMSVNGCLQNIITILIEASGQTINSTLTRKDAVSAQVSLYGAAVSWHRQNLPLVKSSVAAGRLGALSDGENQVAIERPSITSPPVGYRLTSAQFSSVQTSLDRMQLLSYAVDGSTDIFVPMAQANKRLLVNVVDNRASYNIVSATAEDVPPSLTAVGRVANVKWRKQGGAVSGAETAVDADLINVLSLDPTTTYEWSVQNQEASSTSDWSAWQTLTTAAQFNVEYRDVGTQTVETVLGVSGESLEVTGLVSGEQYEFRVQEDDGSTQSAWSAWEPFTTASAGTDQDVTLVSGQQVTQATAIGVSQAAAINAIVASQQTQSQAAPVQQVAALSSIDGQQATEAEQGGVALTALLGAVEAQYVTDADTADLSVELGVASTDADQDTSVALGAVAVDLGVQSSDAEQATSVEVLVINTDAITTVNLVTAEQVISAGSVDVNQLESLTTLILEQALGATLVPTSQVSLTNGVEVETKVQGEVVGVVSDITTNLVTADQLTQAQIVNLLDGTGLSVITVEQGTDLATGDVSILNTVAVINSEQGTEGETIRTGAVAVLSVVNAEQMTEAEIADVLGSAMMVNPRSLRVKRTTIGYTVNRRTNLFRVTLKTT